MDYVEYYNHIVNTKQGRENREMSEEQIKIWEKVEAKGLEKLENIQKAIGTKEGFKEAHKEYCEFVDRLAETTGLTTGELDRHFTNLLADKGAKAK